MALMNPKFNKGFSLVELMVIVAVMGILLAVGVSSSKSLFDGNKLNEAKANFIQAVGRAKAISLRNEFGNTGSQAVAKVCFSSSTVTIVKATSSAVATCGTNVIWTGSIDDGVVVKHTSGFDDDFAAICFSNTGRMIGKTDACSNDTLYNSFQFSLTGSTEAIEEVIF